MLQGFSKAPLGRLVAVFIAAFVVMGGATAALMSVTLSRDPVPMHIRWKPGTSDGERAQLESRFGLTDPIHLEGMTWAYRLADVTTDNIRAMVQHPVVEDTADINRIRYRPRFSNDRQRRLIFFPVVVGGFGAVVAVVRLFFTGRTF